MPHESEGGVVTPATTTSAGVADPGVPHATDRSRALVRVQTRPTRFVPVTRSVRAWIVVIVMAGLGLVMTLSVTKLLPMYMAPILGGVIGGSLAALGWAGRRRLLRAARQLEEPAQRRDALEDLRQLALSPLRVQPVAVDALGHLALDALERGDLQDAIAHTRAIVDLNAEPIRRRVPSAGFLGEAVASILGRLFEEVQRPVAPVDAFHVDEAGGGEDAAAGLDVLVSVLRLVETCDTGDAASVGRVFSELPLAELHGRHPLLASLVHARAVEAAPELEPGLVAAVRELSPPARRILDQRFPALRSPADAAYREPAPELAPITSLALHDVPEPLRALQPSRAPSRWLPVVPRSIRVMGWIYVVMAAITLLDEGSIMMAIAAIAFAPILAGSIYHGRARVRPVLRAGIASPGRIRELRRMSTRGGPRRSDLARLVPFERGELMLIVGLHRAEQAFAASDPEEARAQIAWWLAGADAQTLKQTDPMAIGASAIRVASLLGMHEVAERMSLTFVTRNPERRMRARTGHGDAPRAMALARALMHAVAGCWSDAALQLELASKAPIVELDAFERTLYGTLVRRVRSRGQPVPLELLELATERDADWVETAWPPARDASPAKAPVEPTD